MVDFSIKAHDLLPSVRAAMLNADGSVLDLTEALAVRFIMRGILGIKVSHAAVVAKATEGVVRYDWMLGDTDAPGTYQAEWEITWPNAKPQTVPTTTYHSIEVLADLDEDA